MARGNAANQQRTLKRTLRRPEATVAARRAFVGATRAEYLPRLSLEGSTGYTGATASSLGRRPHRPLRHRSGGLVAGASDFLQVLDAERTLLEAEERLATGRAEAAGALVGVYRAVIRGRLLRACPPSNRPATGLPILRDQATSICFGAPGVTLEGRPPPGGGHLRGVRDG